MEDGSLYLPPSFYLPKDFSHYSFSKPAWLTAENLCISASKQQAYTAKAALSRKSVVPASSVLVSFSTTLSMACYSHIRQSRHEKHSLF